MSSFELRQSRAVFFLPFIGVIIIAVLPWYFLRKYGLNQPTIFTIWWTLLGAWTLRHLIVWLGTTYEIHSNGVTVITRHGIIHKVTQEVPIAKISSVSVLRTGILSLVLGIGDIEIFTIGSSEPVKLKAVNSPLLVQKKISERLGTNA